MAAGFPPAFAGDATPSSGRPSARPRLLHYANKVRRNDSGNPAIPAGRNQTKGA